MKLFLMIGQSNMSGRGEFGEVPDICEPRCLMMRNGLFRRMTEPINCDRQNHNDNYGVCLAASFARDYAVAYDEQVGLIPCADGGSRLDQWQPGEVLYDNAVFLARLGMRAGELAGILWHQGEGDGGTEEIARSYGERFERMISQMRRDLGTDAPVILGELGYFLKDHGGVPYYWIVNEELHRVADAHADFGIASAEGLVSRHDNLHFDSASLREFGSRYFAAYQAVVGRRAD